MSGGAMAGAFGRSPGPIYYPRAVGYGKGPHGKGSEYSLATRSFSCPAEDKKKRDVQAPGPQYDIPSALSKQIESHKSSHTAGKFNASERKTFESGQDRSPGPAAYDTRPSPVKEERRKDGKPGCKLMGSSPRFYPATRTDKPDPPGPGQYKLAATVGGNNAAMHSSPVVAFSKADLRASKLVERSPGPIYTATSAVGKQCSSEKKSAGKFGFGSGSRFPITGSELVDHMNAVHRVKGGIMPTPPRARRTILHEITKAAD